MIIKYYYACGCFSVVQESHEAFLHKIRKCPKHEKPTTEKVVIEE